MRYSLFGLALFSVAAIGATVPDNFNKEKFEKRFHKADKDGNGMLSKEEAYAEFPRAPEFFIEIDANNDNHITLIEVEQAMERRVNAAMNAGSGSGKYVLPGNLESGQSVTTGEVGMENEFSSMREAHRHKYYESLAEDQENLLNRGIPVTETAPPNLLRKSF